METIREVRQDYPGTKMIAMFGGGRTSEFSYLNIAEAFGVDKAFAKPFERQEIFKAIEELVG